MAGRPAKRTRQVCQVCKQNKPLCDYYKTNNSLYQSKEGTFGICKECIQKMTTNEDGSVNKKALNDLMVMMNRPFLPKLLDECLVDAKKRKKRDGTYGISPVALYMSRMSKKTLEYIPMGYNDVMGNNQDVTKEDVTKRKVTNEIRNVIGVEAEEQHRMELERIAAEERQATGEYVLDTYKNFEVTDEMRDLFGTGLTMQEYILLNKKYQTLTQSYPIKTAMHKEFLVTYVKYKVKEEMAIANNDMTSADKWGSMAIKAAENAKLTPKQLTAADLQGGLSSFSEIFEAVEGAKDIISILPKLKQQPNDMADFIIWNYVNYERELNNMPKVDYEDIYKFYDERKEEYLREHGDPFGIFVNDKTQDKTQRETVKKFITIDEDGDE